MSLKRRADRMYATVEVRHENAWVAFAEGLARHLSPRDRRVIKKSPSLGEEELQRRRELEAALIAPFGAGVEWWEWVDELTAVKYDEGVSFWPSDAPLPPPEPEGLWEYLQEKKREDLSELEEEIVVGCILLLSLARARREYEELHESR